MTQDWYWVRHGPTHAKGMVGWTDLPADLGDTAALARLAAYLPAAARVVSSDLTRAATTADAIAAGRLRLPHAPALREMHFGAWEMRHHAEIEAEDRDRIFAFWDQPGDVAPPGGESWNTLRTRVDGWVDAQAAPGPLVAVAHFGVILTQVQRALGVTAREAFAHKIDNLSVTHLRRTGTAWQVETINHLP
ncbi:histidine phosphatase family protein [Dinoroseobacter sp. PD6]|uniref:histidine phosphatase family protein n=1 Tax=Dinoroseobacter sp. PD6 TaxID=3028384 RepID=UPI00237ABBAC|nr:histidine phosphatase family protein [Dinoroseobacter sp. PD6]MDD9716844.1 histidine phosphatase family protein [Dinoroseobacter sp. PD6]